jgi:hypothetical protein
MYKSIAVACSILGTLLAIYCGGYLMFYIGFKEILETCSIVNNKVVVDNLHLCLGGIKVIMSGTVFFFVLNVSAGIFNKLWYTDETEN